MSLPSRKKKEGNDGLREGILHLFDHRFVDSESFDSQLGSFFDRQRLDRYLFSSDLMIVGSDFFYRLCETVSAEVSFAIRSFSTFLEDCCGKRTSVIS
jgi:hypothetical protein